MVLSTNEQLCQNPFFFFVVLSKPERHVLHWPSSGRGVEASTPEEKHRPGRGGGERCCRKRLSPKPRDGMKPQFGFSGGKPVRLAGRRPTLPSLRCPAGREPRRRPPEMAAGPAPGAVMAGGREGGDGDGDRPRAPADGVAGPWRPRWGRGRRPGSQETPRRLVKRGNPAGGWRLTVRQRSLQQQQAEEHPEPHGGSGRGAGLRRGGRGDDGSGGGFGGAAAAGRSRPAPGLPAQGSPAGEGCAASGAASSLREEERPVREGVRRGSPLSTRDSPQHTGLPRPGQEHSCTPSNLRLRDTCGRSVLEWARRWQRPFGRGGFARVETVGGEQRQSGVWGRTGYVPQVMLRMDLQVHIHHRWPYGWMYGLYIYHWWPYRWPCGWTDRLCTTGDPMDRRTGYILQVTLQMDIQVIYQR